MVFKKKKPSSAATHKLLIAIFASMAAMSMQGATPQQARLLVSIMVEGLDSDYLDLLREQFGQGGFRRLERQGVQMTADYGTPLDATAASATVMTGASPALSGVSSEVNFNRQHFRPTYTYADASVLGNYTGTGYSPADLRVTTISDELRIASGGTNVVYSVAPTPGVAISMAGHAANSALWLDEKTGNWASSTAYKEMPASIANRNRAMPLNSRLDTMTWEPSRELASYPALPGYAKRYGFRHTFPHGAIERYDMFMASPFFNREVTEVAQDLINTQKLGTHSNATDVLNLCYVLSPYPYGASTDMRMETMDAYLRLDKDLERLFNDIDRRIGTGNTIVMLAATPPRPQRRRDDDKWNIPCGEFSTRKAVSLLNIYLMALYGNGDYVTAYHDGHIYLNHNLIKENKLNIEDIRSDAASFLSKMTGVDRVFTIDEIVAGHAGENADALRRNTTVSNAGDLLVMAAPGFEIIDDYNNPAAEAHRTGIVQTGGISTAPAFIMAPTVAANIIDTPVDARAIAPTVTRLLRIRSPNGASVPAIKL